MKKEVKNIVITVLTVLILISNIAIASAFELSDAQKNYIANKVEKIEPGKKLYLFGFFVGQRVNEDFFLDKKGNLWSIKEKKIVSTDAPTNIVIAKENTNEKM